MDSRPRAGARPPARRISQVPRLLVRDAPSPSTPESQVPTGLWVDRLPLIRSAPVLASSPLAGWPLSTLRFEACESSLPLRLTSSRRRASTGRLLDTPACFATCVIGISHDELLSVHERSQAWPDAPEGRRGVKGAPHSPWCSSARPSALPGTPSRGRFSYENCCLTASENRRFYPLISAKTPLFNFA